MFPDDLLEKNRAFIAGREARPLPAVEPVRMAVVACYDPRLDPLIRPALGLAEGEGFLLRAAGALIHPGSPFLRSLAMAVYMFDVRQVLVLGHSSCRMAAFDTNRFIDTFRGRGIVREAFGNEDLRSWAGAIASPRDGVLRSAAAIAEAPYLPNDLEIAGAVLDDNTGRIEIVLRPGETPARKLAVAAAEEPPSAPRTTPPPLPPLPGREVATALGALPKSVEPVYRTVSSLVSQSHLGDALTELRQNLKVADNPLRQLGAVRKFVRAGAAESDELKAAFQKLRHELQDASVQDFLRLFQPLLERIPRR